MGDLVHFWKDAVKRLSDTTAAFRDCIEVVDAKQHDGVVYVKVVAPPVILNALNNDAHYREMVRQAYIDVALSDDDREPPDDWPNFVFERVDHVGVTYGLEAKAVTERVEVKTPPPTLSQVTVDRRLGPVIDDPIEKTKERIDQPDHYAGKGMTAIDVIEAFDLGFSRGNAVKYILRAGKKTSTDVGSKKEVEDLRKAVWYLQREIERIEK